MAAGWVKSLQCKSRAVDDVVSNNTTPKQHHQHHQQQQLLPSASCRNSYQSLKDVVVSNSKPRKSTTKNPDRKRTFQPEKPISLSSPSSNRVKRTVSAPIKSPTFDPFFPSVSELPEGHPSRNVVQIIFQTRWGPKGFSGRVETVFKIQNPARDLSRFEEYRASVKARPEPESREGHARCSADGNEMMRFRCLGGAAPTVGFDLKINGGKGATSAVCTYSGSGAAHESAGGGKGRRAMVVCRVIAGRVSKRVELGPEPDGPGRAGFDSVSGEDGELLVFDNRAVLPCFLVIYKL